MKRLPRALSVTLSAAAAVLFALVFFAFNTPLGPSIGSDNAIYLTMGTALARGYAPYTQIFDHKGPMLFLLQWLPQALPLGGYSTLTVFLQECLVLFACLRVASAIARELDAPEIAVQAVYLALFCSLAGGGNLSEEYTSLPTLLGLLITLRVFGRPLASLQERRLLWPAFGLGVCAALCFLTRANNALPLFALAGALSLCLLLKCRFAALGRCAAGFAAGLAAIALPVALWLAGRGALAAGIYGAFLHNLMYAATGSQSRLRMLTGSDYGRFALLILVLSCLGAAALGRRRRTPALCFAALCAAAAGLFAAFVSHKFYDHYLVIGVPLAAFGAAALLGLLYGRPRAQAAAACLALAACLLWMGVKGRETWRWRLSERADLPQFTEDANTLYARVPPEDRGRFMAYRVEPRWYAVTGALPCMRFYFLQETLAEANPAVMDEIVQTFEADPPRWLVIYYNRAFSPPYDPRVAEIFAARYAFEAAAGDYQLLRLREGEAGL